MQGIRVTATLPNCQFENILCTLTGVPYSRFSIFFPHRCIVHLEVLSGFLVLFIFLNNNLCLARCDKLQLSLRLQTCAYILRWKHVLTQVFFSRRSTMFHHKCWQFVFQTASWPLRVSCLNVLVKGSTLWKVYCTSLSGKLKGTHKNAINLFGDRWPSTTER